MDPTARRAAGWSASDPGRCESKIDLQAIEIDVGATKSFSFTAGREFALAC